MAVFPSVSRMVPTVGIGLTILLAMLELTGCKTIERHQAMETAATAPAKLAQADCELAIDAYLWRDDHANEAEGYLQAWAVVFDTRGQALKSSYRVLEYQVIRTGWGAAIGQYPVGGKAASDNVQMLQPESASGQLCCWLRHDLANTGLSPNYDIAVVLEKSDTLERLMLRTRNQPVHRVPPPSDWFHQAIVSGPPLPSR